MRTGASLAVLVALLLAGGPARSESSNANSATEWSDPAPLASRSLMLDATECAGRVVAVGERGHVLLSADGRPGSGTPTVAGEMATAEADPEWRQVRVPTRSMLTAVTAVGNDVWAVGHDAVIAHSADRGETWTRQHAAPENDTPLLDVWFGDARRGIAVGAYGLALATTDGGASWQALEIGEDERHLNAIARAADGTLYVAAEDGIVFVSGDGGESWQEMPTGYTGSLFGVVPLRSGTVLVFGLRGHVLRSDDRGKSWISTETGTTATLLGGTESTDGTLFIVGLSGTVLVSRDGGHHFEVRSRPDRHALALAMSVSEGRVLLLGEDGVRRVGRRELVGS